MNKEKWKIRKSLRGINSIKEFEELINSAMISDEDRNLLRMHYAEDKSLTYIADELGVSESTIKKRHSKLLLKLGSFF